MIEFHGETLRNLRKSKGMTQEELQKLLGMKQKDYINNIEEKNKLPGKETLKKIVEFFGVHEDFFTVKVEEIEKEYLLNTVESVTEILWKLMKDSFDNKFELREETYTESSLLQFKKRLKKNFFIQKTSTHTESKNGADWQWFIIRDGYWIAFSVQAKKVKERNGQLTYESLHYPKKPDKDKANQCQTLILNAWREGKIPIYCFYNFIPKELLNIYDLKESIDTLPPFNKIVNSVKTDYSPLAWTFCFADHLHPTKDLIDSNFEYVTEKSTNFKNMFLRNFEEIVNEYNNLNGGDSNEDNQGDGGTPNSPQPKGDGPSSGGYDLESLYKELEIEFKVLDKNELMKYKQNVRINLNGIQDLPEYAKGFLSKNTDMKFGEYPDSEPEVTTVYSIFQHHPFPSTLDDEMVISGKPSTEINTESEVQDPVSVSGNIIERKKAKNERNRQIERKEQKEQKESEPVNT